MKKETIMISFFCSHARFIQLGFLALGREDRNRYRLFDCFMDNSVSVSIDDVFGRGREGDVEGMVLLT